MVRVEACDKEVKADEYTNNTTPRQVMHTHSENKICLAAGDERCETPCYKGVIFRDFPALEL